MTPLPLRLAIFDCDGVLVDSEGPSNRLVAQELALLGWHMDEDEAMRRFVGVRLSDLGAIAEAHLGRKVPPGWVEHLRGRLIAVLGAEVETMPGIPGILHQLMAMGLPFRVASNSGHEEMRVKFARTGLTGLFAGRAHSAYDVGKGKPAPDVFLAAAAAEGVPPGACVVIEDSVPGVQAAIAAGMACLGLDPHGDGAALRELGAYPISSLGVVPGLLRGAMRGAA